MNINEIIGLLEKSKSVVVSSDETLKTAKSTLKTVGDSIAKLNVKEDGKKLGYLVSAKRFLDKAINSFELKIELIDKNAKNTAAKRADNKKKLDERNKKEFRGAGDHVELIKEKDTYDKGKTDHAPAKEGKEVKETDKKKK